MLHHLTFCVVLLAVTVSSQNDGTELENGGIFDFIIIGAGSAGSVVARRLSEVHRWRILLIEAGDEPLAESIIPFAYQQLLTTEMNWNYKTESQIFASQGMNDKKSPMNQGKCLGGTSSLNFMIYVRGNPEDFNEWEKLGNEGWGYKEVLKYFKKSENQADHTLSREFHGFGGLQDVSQFPVSDRFTQFREAYFAGIKELGFALRNEVNGEQQIGFAPVYGTIFDGERRSTRISFLQGSTPNLTILKNSFAEKIIVMGNRAVGVEFERNEKKFRVFAKKEVILSAGALNSPKILMLSGIGPKKHLRQMGIPVVKNLPGVGQNLQDHVIMDSIYILKPSFPCLNLQEAEEMYAESHTGPFATIGFLGDVVGFVDTLNNSQIPDNQIFASIACANETSFFTNFLAQSNVRADIIEKYEEFLTGHDALFMSTYLLKPESHGSVTLKSNNPKDPPTLAPNHLMEPNDVQTLIRGLRTVMKILNTTELKQFEAKLIDTNEQECKELKPDSDERYECLVRLMSMSGSHYAGTCKMGPKTDPMAVVDSRLRVYGVKRLRVVDNSIMPRVTRGNTNAPAIMIGERGADFIKQDWKVVQG